MSKPFKMSSISPGSWNAEGLRVTRDGHLVCRVERDATIEDYFLQRDNAEANALAISILPELIEEAKSAVVILRAVGQGKVADALDAILIKGGV